MILPLVHTTQKSFRKFVYISNNNRTSIDVGFKDIFTRFDHNSPMVIIIGMMWTVPSAKQKKKFFSG